MRLRAAHMLGMTKHWAKDRSIICFCFFLTQFSCKKSKKKIKNKMLISLSIILFEDWRMPLPYNLCMFDKLSCSFCGQLNFLWGFYKWNKMSEWVKKRSRNDKPTFSGICWWGRKVKQLDFLFNKNLNFWKVVAKMPPDIQVKLWYIPQCRWQHKPQSATVIWHIWNAQ